jgi:magnesium transporter
MISSFLLDDTGLHRREVAEGTPVPDGSIWVDLLEPSAEEEQRLESQLGIDVPTPEEMREIETSNRLYEEAGVLYMTATVVTKIETDRPESSQVTFILTPDTLVTNRYTDPLPFRRFIAYAARHAAQCSNAIAILAGLLEALVNRIADVLERIAADMDTLSSEVFTPPAPGMRRRTRDYRAILERVGRAGDLNSKAREALSSLSRLLVFLQQAEHPQMNTEMRHRLRTLSRDVSQMSDHAGFIASKVQFQLDATLGMINIDQNNILKIFSVATVVLLPPSVIGAIFGMNFDLIPAASQPWGFWGAIGLMVVSAVVPWWAFKRLGWL